MKIERGPTAVEVDMTSVFLETADSKPISMEFEQDMSTQVMRSSWRLISAAGRAAISAAQKKRGGHQEKEGGQRVITRSARLL